MSSSRDWEDQRKRFIFQKWIRPKDGPVVPQGGSPRGTTTPDGLAWGHDLGSFFYFERVPNVNVYMIWSRSMIKEFGENYDEDSWPEPEPKPRVRRPWPVLKLPRKVQKELKIDPPLGAVDEGSDHELEGAYEVLWDDDGFDTDKAQKESKLSSAATVAEGEVGEGRVEIEDVVVGESNPGDSVPEDNDFEDEGPAVEAEKVESVEGNEDEENLNPRQRDDLVTPNDPNNHEEGEEGHAYSFMWAPHVRVELFLTASPTERQRLRNRAPPHVAELFAAALEAEALLHQSWQQEYKGSTNARLIVTTPRKLPPEGRNYLLAIQARRMNEESRQNAPWLAWNFEYIRIVYADEDYVCVAKADQDKGKEKNILQTFLEDWASGRILDDVVQQALSDHKKMPPPPWKAKGKGAPSPSEIESGAPAQAAQGKKKPKKKKSKGKKKEKGKEVPPPIEESKRDEVPAAQTTDIPKLQEFIPAAFFPDVLMVHDPNNLTPGKEGTQDAQKQDGDAKPIKYKRVFPTDEGLDRNKTTDTETERIAHAYLTKSSLMGEGHHSLVYRTPLELPPPLSARSPNKQVQVVAKLAIPAKSARWLLSNEAIIYDTFPKYLMEEYCGFSLVKPIHHPVPVGAIVPKFYGYWVPADEDRMCGEQERSPILLLEDCGTPIRASEFSPDERAECMSMILRLHNSGFLQGSSYERNFCLQPGPLTLPPALRTLERPSLRIIDFGRAEYLKDLIGLPYGVWTCTDVDEKRQEEISQAQRMLGLSSVELW